MQQRGNTFLIDDGTRLVKDVSNSPLYICVSSQGWQKNKENKTVCVIYISHTRHQKQKESFLVPHLFYVEPI